MLNNCEIRDMIVRYHCFASTGNVHSRIEQAEDKVDKQTVESDNDVIMSSTKTSVWSGLQIRFRGGKLVTKYRSKLRGISIMDSGTTINLFGNPKMIANRQKMEIPVNFLVNTGSKIVDEVGKIPGSG